ncbi:acyl-CoA dehydrogenase [Pseudonocardia sp. EC080610-09]|uniref:acyl-CoA dehydrogenase family protein n=1 Tax=unclassified Pseudonocardia TaxID=2619320 RepID=UPI0006CB3720|nr:MULTISPECIES: acyl-CoA dehydrogenase family protein [unclassified Pseudonocardia]ALE73337.1 acyl-CoA dehydrogenase [Pseudonocardia sp. EC080625-04]ALL76673.1 acyl-CoA dehydrogenase [Pseudonocardia sp. EC080610-09]ALL83701.1 acyl-CoA dehydrogenase [Pseudonocardia sp. EC080619-01]
MDFSLPDDHRDIRAAVADLAGRFDGDYWTRHDREHLFPTEFYRAFAEAGWLGIGIPTEYGGGGLGVAAAGLLLETIAASGAAMNGCTPLHLSVFGINVVTRHGSEELRREVLPRVATGELQVCFGVTEPDAGTDTSRIRTVAVRDGDGYRISGRKVWISKAAESDRILLATRTAERDPAAPMEGLSIFLVDMDDPGIATRAIPKMGRNAVASYEVTLDDVRVPAGRLVGAENEGFRVLLDGLNPERILLAHEALGIGRASVDAAVRYAGEREVFGRPIGQNQGIAFPLAEANARLDAAELVCRQAAWLYDRGDRCAREANTAKFLAADAGYRAADQALQTFGGMGYADEYHVNRYFREARLMRIAPVSQELALAFIAQNVLGLPKSY